MLNSIWQDIQRQFQFGNRVTQIILVNVAVFIAINLARVILQFASPEVFEAILHFFAVSKLWLHNLTHPWVFLTYAFVHEGFRHILFNMLIFYWFGRIVGDLIGDKAVFPLYFWGAVAGSVLYFITANLLNYGAPSQIWLIGASGSVMATVVAAAILAPEYSFRLILIGEVRLKYIALTIILLDLFSLGLDGNTGGHFAHIGGMLMGYFYVQQLRAGNNLADPINSISNSIIGFFTGFGASRKPSPRRSSKPSLATSKTRIGVSKRSTTSPEPVEDLQTRLDFILEKIKATGIDSLTSEERDFLSQASRKKS